jgi:hypothetical protein
MESSDEYDSPSPLRRLVSPADALAVYAEANGEIVIRHQDAFEETTLVVMPREAAMRLLQAIRAAVR